MEGSISREAKSQMKFQTIKYLRIFIHLPNGMFMFTFGEFFFFGFFFQWDWMYSVFAFERLYLFIYGKEPKKQTQKKKMKRTDENDGGVHLLKFMVPFFWPVKRHTLTWCALLGLCISSPLLLVDLIVGAYPAVASLLFWHSTSKTPNQWE